MADLTPCPKCGKPHTRNNHPTCTAHRRDGTPCTQWRWTNQAVCKMHGAMKPAAKDNAAKRAGEADAAATIRKLFDKDAPPITDPIAAMHKLAGQLEKMVERLGDELESSALDENGHSALPRRAAYFERMVGHFRSLLDAIAKLDLGGRMVELEESKVKLTAIAIGRALDSIGVSGVERERAIGVLVRELRRGQTGKPAALLLEDREA